MSDLNIEELRRLQAAREAAHKAFDEGLLYFSLAGGVVAGQACDDADDELKTALLKNASSLLNSHEESRRLKEENEELRKGWRPIETAPKDGTSVLLLGWPGQEHGVCVGYWEPHFDYNEWTQESTDSSCWTYDDYDQDPIEDWQPTHWMPLPAKPESAQQEQVKP